MASPGLNLSDGTSAIHTSQQSSTLMSSGMIMVLGALQSGIRTPFKFLRPFNMPTTSAIEIMEPVTALKNGGNCTLTINRSVGSRVSISDKTAVRGMGLKNFRVIHSNVAMPNELAYNAVMISLG